MTSRALLPALLLAAAALTACGEDDSPEVAGDPDPGRVLTIVSSDWNGWDPDHRPTPETTTVPARVGATAAVEGVAFEVTQVMGSRVEVTSDHRLATEGETGGSDLTDLRDVFMVSAGRDTELDTPTLDGGVSYTLTLSS